ncbi:MAG: nucleotide exchange factor GrpE [Mediterranea sp.]|jgi:molecular chaperone GrpE (heat shock protein)|nr:nucleotide exchange factor GrpE [Mediterranea sp.]
MEKEHQETTATQVESLEELIGKIGESKKPLLISLLKAMANEEADAPAAEGEVPATPAATVDLSELKNIVADLKKIFEETEVFAYKDRINKELHEELQKHQGGLRKEFVSPLLKHIIREYDRAINQYRFYLHKTEEEPQGELFAKLLREFDMVANSLLNLLDDYGLETYDAVVGADIVPKEYKIIKVVETSDPELSGKVAQAIACGFRDMEHERVVRQAEVAVYKLAVKEEE